MRKRKTLLGVGLLLAFVVLGIGYAAISDVNLTITGTATAMANEEFAVSFDVDTEIETTTFYATTYTENKDAIEIDANYIDEYNATFEVTGLSASGDYVEITYAVHNESSELAANLSAEITTTDEFDEDYFFVDYNFSDYSQSITLDAGDSETLTVYIAMNSTAYEEMTTGAITVTLTASPVIDSSSSD